MRAVERVSRRASECTVRPYFRSPSMVTVRLSRRPNSSMIVKASSRAWVGCSPDAVARVDDGLARACGRQRRRAGLGMAQHDHVRVALQRANRVGQGFALGHRRVAHFADRDHAAAQALHGRQERRRRARRRFVEQVGQDLALEQIEGAHALDHRAHFFGHAEDVFQGRSRSNCATERMSCP